MKKQITASIVSIAVILLIGSGCAQQAENKVSDNQPSPSATVSPFIQGTVPSPEGSSASAPASSPAGISTTSPADGASNNSTGNPASTSGDTSESSSARSSADADGGGRTQSSPVAIAPAATTQPDVPAHADTPSNSNEIKAASPNGQNVVPSSTAATNLPPVTTEDPVPDAKTVNLSQTEIAKVAEQYEQLAASDGSETGWKQEADRIIAKGMSYLGTPYVFGAKTGQTANFDCSSFMKYIFASQKVKLPRDAREQSQLGQSVSQKDLREGDLVFFTTPKRKNEQGVEHIGHVGIYLGDGLILHTFRPGIGVTISELSGPWQQRFVEAKRILS